MSCNQTQRDRIGSGREREQDDDDTIPTYGKWTPIVQSQRIEPFASEYFVDNKGTVSIVTNIFIVMACMIIAAFVGILFYWSYYREQAMFIAILSGVTLAYAIMNVIYFAIKSNQVEDIALRIYLGSSIFVAILNIVLVIFFAISAREKMRSGSRSGSGMGSMSSDSSDMYRQ